MQTKALAPEYQGALTRMSVNASLTDVLAEGVRHLKQAERSGSQEEVARAGLAVAEAHRRLGQVAEADRAWKASYRAARSAGNTGAMAWALWSGGTLARQRGSLRLAFRLLGLAAEAGKRGGDVVARGYSLAGLAETGRIQGDYATVATLHEQLLAEARARGEARHTVWALEGIAQIHRNTGSLDSALEMFEEAASWRARRTTAGAGPGRCAASPTSSPSGTGPRPAPSPALRGRGHLPEMNLSGALAYNHKMRANVLFRAGRYAEAREVYEQALGEFRAMDEPRGEALASLGLVKARARLAGTARPPRPTWTNCAAGSTGSGCSTPARWSRRRTPNWAWNPRRPNARCLPRPTPGARRPRPPAPGTAADEALHGPAGGSPAHTGPVPRTGAPALVEAVGRLHPWHAETAAFSLGWRGTGGEPLPGSQGKGVRQALAVLGAEAAGGSAADAVPGAVAVELIHTFSLIHDDIMDGDETRRRRPTLWKAYGTGPAVLAGDALFALAVSTLAEAPGDASPAAVRHLARALGDLVHGQAQDLLFETRPWTGPGAVLPHEYRAMATHKTGSLLGCAAALARHWRAPRRPPWRRWTGRDAMWGWRSRRWTTCSGSGAIRWRPANRSTATCDGSRRRIRCSRRCRPTTRRPGAWTRCSPATDRSTTGRPGTPPT